MKYFKIVFFIILSTLFSCKKPLSQLGAIDSEIKNITKLSTYQHIYKDIVYIKEDKNFFSLSLHSKSVLFSVNINVTAGIDYDKIKYKIEDKTITVTLPDAEIFSIDADETSIVQYFIKEKNSKIDLLTIYNAINEKKTEIELDAINRGILNKAENNAEILISDFLFSIGFKEVFFGKKEKAID